jgi:hypothetical protein
MTKRKITRAKNLYAKTNNFEDRETVQYATPGRTVRQAKNEQPYATVDPSVRYGARENDFWAYRPA